MSYSISSSFSAAYNGKRDVCEILLRAFPDLINTLTVERWSPLHAACINGHAGMFFDWFVAWFYSQTRLAFFIYEGIIIKVQQPLSVLVVLDFLLRFPYPKDRLRRVRDRNSQLEYSVQFDINQRDVSGQTVLYLACCVGNLKIVESLLNYKVHRWWKKLVEIETIYNSQISWTSKNILLNQL